MKKPTRLEKMEAKRKALNERISTAKSRERKKEKAQVAKQRAVWGEVVETMLQAGAMNPEEWEKHCNQYLAKDWQKTLAIGGLVRVQVEEKKEGKES